MMGSRIRTLQLQARELGRLRSGTYDASKKQMKRSEFWIVTSLSDTRCEAAAALWGGTVEKWTPQSGTPQFRVITAAVVVDAILPPGDPLSQSYEMWNRGGCARRCDGYTETLTDSPCICRAEYGPDFHEVAPRDTACKMTTRLNVILPQMPDIGVFRVESHSYYAAVEIAATIEMLRSAAGPEALIPISVRIEPRKRVSGGKTKQFPVIAVELRGATAGQVLEAAAGLRELASGSPVRAAIEAARPDYVAQAKSAKSQEEFLAVVNAAESAAHMDDALRAELGKIWAANTAKPSKPAADPIPTAEPNGASDAEVVDGEPIDEDEADRKWALIMENAPGDWDSNRLSREFANYFDGELPASASLAMFDEFLDYAKKQAAAA
jgi:hypothetical protein